MSKTVKKVMTIMMIGLVAMLAANAEAHYIIVAASLGAVSFVLIWTLGTCRTTVSPR
jgi:hypothetical protein